MMIFRSKWMWTGHTLQKSSDFAKENSTMTGRTLLPAGPLETSEAFNRARSSYLDATEDDCTNRVMFRAFLSALGALMA